MPWHSGGHVRPHTAVLTSCHLSNTLSLPLLTLSTTILQQTANTSCSTSCSTPCLLGISNCCGRDLPQYSPSPLWSRNPDFPCCCHFPYLMPLGNLTESLLVVSLGSKVVRNPLTWQNFFQLMWLSFWLRSSLSSLHILVSQSREGC